MSIPTALYQRYAPYLVFHPDEICYPISIEKYLSVCKPLDAKYNDQLVSPLVTPVNSPAVSPVSATTEDNSPKVTTNSIKEVVDQLSKYTSTGQIPIINDYKEEKEVVHTDIPAKSPNKSPMVSVSLSSQAESLVNPYSHPTSKAMYHAYKAGATDLHLEFNDPINESLNKLAGNINQAVGYVHVINSDTCYKLVYYYLFSHTSPYKCCMFGFPLTKWEHKADLKYIIVEVNKIALNIKRIYYGAHGSQSGVWKNADDVEYLDGHPIAYSAKGDHSFYFDSGIHPRIYFTVYDECAKHYDIMHTRVCRPQIVRTNDESDAIFNDEFDGWNYFPGQMNTDGIDAPAKQGFFNANIPEVSNTWYKRLFCCNYF